MRLLPPKFSRLAGRAFYWNADSGSATAYVGGVATAITDINAGGKWYVNSAGTLVNAAAGSSYIHHVHNGTSYTPRGVLWEPAVQNLFTQSETLGAGGLANQVRASAGSNADTAPDGTATADRLIEDSTAGNTHYALTSAYTLTAASYVFGTFAKAGTRTKIELWNSTASKGKTFDLSAGTMSVGTLVAGVPNDAGMVKVGSYYYCWIAFTGTAAAHTIGVALNNGTTTTYDGDGASYATLWGHQLHLGSGPGSYIKSAGSATTRTADTASISSAFLTPIKGAFPLDIDYTPNGSTASNERVLAGCLDGSNNGFELYISTDAKLSLRWNNAAATLQSAALTWAAGTTYKLRMLVNGTTVTLYQDRTGASVASAAQAAGLTTIDTTFYMGQDRSGAKQANGAVRLIEAVPA